MSNNCICGQASPEYRAITGLVYRARVDVGKGSSEVASCHR